MKRAIDIMGSGIALLVFGPLMLIIAAAIRIFDPGPVIFRQRRLGRFGKAFYIYKFRTMVVNAEELLKSNPCLYREYVENSFTIDVKRDPRISRLGKFLRQSSLDELPQLLNVLKGEMSLVGPRPIVEEELIHYGDKKDAFLSAKPGLTGYWQASGRDNIRYPGRVDVELYYVQNQRISLDLWIIFKTAALVFLRKGVS